MYLLFDENITSYKTNKKIKNNINTTNKTQITIITTSKSIIFSA